MRRLLVPLLPLLLLASGCSTAEAKKAQELLAQADAAQRQLTSSGFEGGISFSVAGEAVSVTLEGAHSGTRGFVRVRSATLPDANMTVVRRGAEIWMHAGGSWQRLPAAQSQGLDATTLGPEAFAALTRHVEDVRVTEGQMIGGRPVSIVAGEIDTAGLVASLGDLGGLRDLGSGFDVDDLREQLGDVEAVLTIDSGSKLLTSALVKLSLGSGAEAVDLKVDYRLTSWNEPVRIPSPGA